MIRKHALTTSALALAALTSMGAAVNGKIKVVATTPDLAAVAREIGGDAVDVLALAKSTEDPHFVDAKPSHIVTLNRADVLIEGGAELELGWLPPLLESARNAKIAAGAPGRVVASQGIKMLEVPTTFDRSKGDVHSLGNPHFMIDPVSVKIVAANMADHFAQVDPKNAATYKANLAAFNTKVDMNLKRWQQELAAFKDSKIVTYHKDFPYFAERFHLDIVENLEPKPGISPSPAHLAQVIQTMKSTGARVIVVQPYQNRRTAETVARQTNGIVVDIPQQPGAKKGAETYFKNMDNMVSALATALGGK